MKRSLSLLLILATIVAVFAGCQTPAPTQGPQTTNQTVTDGPKFDQWGRPWVDSVLPDGLNFGGQTVNILLAAGTHPYRDYYAEAYNDDIINDSVFDRNVKVETDLGVKLNWILGSETSATTLPKEIAAVVKAGTNNYDIAAGYGNYMPVGVTELSYTNLYDVPYLKDSLAQGKPWWNKNYVDEAGLNGFLYTVTGDLSLSSIHQISCMFFNKRLADKHLAAIGGSQGLYQLVLEGKWTVDNFAQLAVSLYEDLNTNEQRDLEDFYALIPWMPSSFANAFQYGMNAPVTQKNAQGIPELVIGSQHTKDALQKLNDLLHNCPGVLFDTRLYSYSTGAPQREIRNKFPNGTVLFVAEALKEATQLPNMADSIGLLPMPMYDQAQFEAEGYTANVYDSFSTLVIPKGVLDAGRGQLAGATLEKLCEESYRTVTPNYFEAITKRPYLRTNDQDYDRQMYDIILDSAVFDFGMIYGELIDQPNYVARHLISRDKLLDFDSLWNQIQPTVEGKFNALLSFYSKNAK